MFDIKEIKEPKSLDEALKVLDSNTKLKIISGGTDVLIKLHHGKFNDAELLSIKNLDTLRDIKVLEDNTISIGANVTFSDIFRSEVINNNIPILSEAAVSMGGPQIRNMATIGGNICNGAVSADSAPALFSLNAELKLKSLNNERIVKITEFYDGPGKVKIQRNEILTEILIKEENYKNKRGRYIKFANRKALDISMLGVALLYEIEDNSFKDLRISLGVASPTPIRCKNAENFAIGKGVTNEVINKVAELAKMDSNPRNSWRGSRDYRLHLISTLIKRILNDDLIKSEVK
ncbi:MULTISPECIES: xanthine dehydrogenase subunit XdhB [Clostridia]|jgi:xanthine dehydrogenase FAD-binding subunit|uniref:Xanthine dehydrogenase FAD-binding subunit XdhB n=1 Tax=Clostridium saudiense TaxID=1414720 RepID=A0ABS2FIY9_9CLOT|nr:MULTISPECIES: xanthine dehydrogenase subunit XdhB [Clostridiaceae]MBM6820266.1 xanthine dehydrogenase FAD-binding subunit XdhB [Clostridium saudiense]